LISYCTIEGNHASTDGGGIYCEDSSPTIEYCLFKDNDAGGSGGGIGLEGDVNPEIRYCTFVDNQADFGGGINCVGATPDIINCTLYNNEAMYGGGICCISNAAPTIKNTVFAGTPNGYGIYLMSSPNATLTYCDFYDNQNAHYAGSTPPDIGILVSVNANGDSCDVYHNLFLDPVFVDPASYDFNLQESSPCIDAGDPASPLDPDNSIADIGAWYFDQSAPQIELSNDLLSFPDTYVGESSSLSFTIYNTGTADLILYDMVNALPNIFTADWLPEDSLIIPGDSLVVEVAFSPSDTLLYTDDLVIDNNDVQVSLALEGQGLAVSGISDQGTDLPSQFALYPAYPNPFNPTTSIGFSLPVGGKVSLLVFDVSGRQVTELFDGWRPAGRHAVSFDASGLANGVYWVRMQAGKFQQVQKLLLIK